MHLDRAAFTRDSVPGRVVFGLGSVARAADEVAALGLRRVMVIAAGSSANAGAALVAGLGPLAAGTFDQVRQHVPAELAAAAADTAGYLAADGVLAVGGGSAIGLGKAVAVATGAVLVAVPTTYSGSEMTPIHGITGRHKRVGRDEAARPRLVLYDPELTVGLPPAMTAASGFNALAHCVEALYAPGTDPVAALQATAGITALARWLPVAVRAPADPDARHGALFGAYLAGCALATAGTALHHKLCHVLGGTFGLGHAEVNSVLLPHVAAFNQRAVPDAMAAVAAALAAATGAAGAAGAGGGAAAGGEGSDAAAGLYDLAVRIGAPTSLAALGMAADGLAEAARLAVDAVGDSNPREVGVHDLYALLSDAHAGRPPGAGTRTPPQPPGHPAAVRPR